MRARSRPLGLTTLRNHPLLARGVVNGLIGAAVVAVWFFVLDLASGNPFRTPRRSARLCYSAPRDPGRSSLPSAWSRSTPLSTSPRSSWPGSRSLRWRSKWSASRDRAARAIDRDPARGLVLATIGVGAQWVLGTLGWLSVAVANALAVVAMGWQVWRTHPTLQRRLLEEHPQFRV